jgi:hypothetical protein
MQIPNADWIVISRLSRSVLDIGFYGFYYDRRASRGIGKLSSSAAIYRGGQTESG